MSLWSQFNAIKDQDDDQETAVPVTPADDPVPGPTDQPAPVPESGAVQVSGPLPGQHQPNDGSGMVWDEGVQITEPLPGQHQPGDGSGMTSDPPADESVPGPTDQDGGGTVDPDMFQGGDVDVVDTPNPFGEGTFGFDAYQEGLDQNRSNTDALNQAASDFAISGYGDFSRWDNDLVQQGLGTIQETLARLGREGTNSIEGALANRGLTGSSVEADQLKDLQLGLNEQANQFGFNLAREMANTYANDRATQADIGLATAGLLGQTESDRFGQDFSVYGRDLDENFRRTGMTLDEDFRRDNLGLNEDFRRDSLGLDEAYRRDLLGFDRDRFGFSQDLAREGAFQDRFGVISDLAARYPDSFNPDQYDSFLYGGFGFPGQFGQSFQSDEQRKRDAFGGGVDVPGFSSPTPDPTGGADGDPTTVPTVPGQPEQPLPESDAPSDATTPGTTSNAARRQAFEYFGINGPEDIDRLSDFQRNLLEQWLAELEARGL